MKIRALLLPIVVALILVSCSKSAITKTKIETNNDTLSYAFGINIYYSLMADSIDLDPAIIARAMVEAAKDNTIMDEEMARSYIYAYINEREQKRIGQQAELNKELYKDLIAEGDSFLQKTKRQKA